MLFSFLQKTCGSLQEPHWWSFWGWECLTPNSIAFLRHAPSQFSQSFCRSVCFIWLAGSLSSNIASLFRSHLWGFPLTSFSFHCSKCSALWLLDLAKHLPCSIPAVLNSANCLLCFQSLFAEFLSFYFDYLCGCSGCTSHSLSCSCFSVWDYSFVPLSSALDHRLLRLRRLQTLLLRRSRWSPSSSETTRRAPALWLPSPPLQFAVV